MSKQSGLGDRLLIDVFDVSGDTAAVQTVSSSAAVLDATGIDKHAVERLYGLRDGTIEFQSHWNPGPEANAAHQVHSTLPTVDRQVTYLRGTAAGAPAATLPAKQLNYDGARGNDGAFGLSVSAQANNRPVEWGRQLTVGSELFTGPGSGVGVDDGITTTAGVRVVAHVLALTGTDVTVTVEDSPDNAAWAFLTASGVFSTPGTQLFGSGAATVDRWLRATLSGTFTAATVAVVAVRVPDGGIETW